MRAPEAKISANGKEARTEPAAPRIVTNMRFWQSAVWCDRVASIYGARHAQRDSPPLGAWREAVLLFRHRRAYDVVLTMGARESLLYGLLCALAGTTSKQILCEVFLDEPRPWNPLWQIKTSLFRLIASRALGVLTNSSAEIQSTCARLNLPARKVRFVPLPTTISNPELCASGDGYILAAGYTRRDYDTLLRAAPLIPAPIRILCGRADRPRGPLPANVTVRADVPWEEYVQILRRCDLVALPLQETARATGQVVLLEAMAFGKPVVATRAAGTLDYVRDRINGLLVAPGDAQGLARAVCELLNRPSWARQLGEQALNDVRERHLPDHHAEAKLAAIAELWRDSRGASKARFPGVKT